MGFLGFGKKREKTIDFTRVSNVHIPASNSKFNGEVVDLRKANLIPINQSSETQSNIGSNIDFLNTMASASSPASFSEKKPNVVTQVSELSELKHKMRVMTGKVEELSNENYRLIQKIELLERKIERLESRR